MRRHRNPAICSWLPRGSARAAMFGSEPPLGAIRAEQLEKIRDEIRITQRGKLDARGGALGEGLLEARDVLGEPVAPRQMSRRCSRIRRSSADRRWTATGLRNAMDIRDVAPSFGTRMCESPADEVCPQPIVEVFMQPSNEYSRRHPALVSERATPRRSAAHRVGSGAVGSSAWRAARSLPPAAGGRRATVGPTQVASDSPGSNGAPRDARSAGRSYRNRPLVVVRAVPVGATLRNQAVAPSVLGAPAPGMPEPLRADATVTPLIRHADD